MFSSANVITGHITSVSGFVTSYLNLRDINRELLERNGQLEMELLELQDQLEMMRADTALFVGFAPDSTGQFPYSFVMADVVNNSVTYLSNYITVNKGVRMEWSRTWELCLNGVSWELCRRFRPFFRCNPSVESEVQTELQGVGE